MPYQNKKVAVLGAGLSGTAAALLLKEEGADVTVLDSAEEKNLLKSTLDNLRAQGVRIIAGPAADGDATPYDLIVLSPGIDPVSPLARNFSARKIETIGELELGWRSCTLPVIAITGTNGKTTTTELLAQMLNACGQRTIACGNIGKPLCEVVRRQKDFDVLTVEVSSFQLETIQTFRPSVALWLNFAPDHLDRYRSVWEYREAKLRIFENQTAEDFAIMNAVETLRNLRARKITFSAYTDQADFRLVEGAIVYQDQVVLRLADTKLRGSHNIENLMATLAAGCARGLSFAQMVHLFCPTSRARTGANSCARWAGSITSMTPRRPTWMRWRKRWRRKAGRLCSSPAARTRVSILSRCARSCSRRSNPPSSSGRWPNESRAIGTAPCPVKWPVR